MTLTPALRTWSRAIEQDCACRGVTACGPEHENVRRPERARRQAKPHIIRDGNIRPRNGDHGFREHVAGHIWLNQRQTGYHADGRWIADKAADVRGRRWPDRVFLNL